MQVNRAQSTDVPLAMRLIERFIEEATDFGMSPTEGKAVLETYRRGLASLINRDEWRVWLCSRQSNAQMPEGILIARLAHADGSIRVQLIECFVEARARKQGVAAALIGASRDWAREVQATRITLTTPVRLAAAGIWRKLGFETREMELQCEV